MNKLNAKRSLVVLLALATALTCLRLGPWAAAPAYASTGVVCRAYQYPSTYWPTLNIAGVYVVSVNHPATPPTPADACPYTDRWGNNSYTYVTSSDLYEGLLVCTAFMSNYGIASTTLPAPWAYDANPVVASQCQENKTDPNPPPTALKVYCPSCPHASLIVNDASLGRSADGDGVRNGIAPNALTNMSGSNLAAQTASRPAGSTACLDTLGDRKVRIESFNGTWRWACLTAVSPTFIQFYLNATPSEVPVHKDNDGRVRLYDGSGNQLNLNATYGAALRLTAIEPGLYSADGSSHGFPRGYVKRVRPDGSQVRELLTNGKAIALGPAGDKVYLVLYGTGFRWQNRNDAFYLRVGDKYYGLTGNTANSFGPADGRAELDEVDILVDRAFTYTNQNVYLQSNSGNDADSWHRLSNPLYSTIRVNAQRPSNDYDRDGKTDRTLWNGNDGHWRVVKSSTGEHVDLGPWGDPGDIPVPGDYDGDGVTDRVVFRPTDQNWYFSFSSVPWQYNAKWGDVGDKPVPADYDGDGKTDLAVWHPADGRWSIFFSATQTRGDSGWGIPGDIPVPGDYDGDGRADRAVWRPTDQTWHIAYAAGGVSEPPGYGLAGDIPVVADYDGDGITDRALWRPTNHQWYVYYSASRPQDLNPWGQDGDIPKAADYDGDGSADRAIWRPGDGHWWITYAAGGGGDLGPWGEPRSGDVPL